MPIFYCGPYAKCITAKNRQGFPAGLMYNGYFITMENFNIEAILVQDGLI